MKINQTGQCLHMLHIPQNFLCTASQEYSVTNQCVLHYRNEVSQIRNQDTKHINIQNKLTTQNHLRSQFNCTQYVTHSGINGQIYLQQDLYVTPINTKSYTFCVVLPIVPQPNLH